LVPGILFTITGPFGVEINNGDYHHTPFGGGENNAHLLAIVGNAFQRVFGIGPAGGLAFAVIDAALLQDLLHFRLINMAAIHAAPGMLGVNEVTGMAVNDIGSGVFSTCAGILAGCETNAGKKE
jgi:hypothetical protein